MISLDFFFPSFSPKPQVHIIAVIFAIVAGALALRGATLVYIPVNTRKQILWSCLAICALSFIVL